MTFVRATACAKINWALEVLHRRPDGYHEIRTVLQTIDLCDTLELHPATDLCLETRGEGLPPAEENLVMRAARLLQERADGSPGARVRLSKSIPVAAGLGGGSSDAAAALRGLNELWGLGLPRDELAKIGAQLGSDVPFFLHGGAALAGGRGERITPLPDVGSRQLVIVVPPFTLPHKTQRMYSLLAPADYTDGSATERVADAIRQGKPVEDERLFNVFDEPAFRGFPELQRLRGVLLAGDAASVHLAGSGPALFVLADDVTVRERLARSAAEAGARAFAVTTAPEAATMSLEVAAR